MVMDLSITHLAAILAGGLLGSAHCIGMCGGFAAAIGATHRPFWPTFGRQIVYSLGRLFTYGFLGAVGGSTGLYMARYRLPFITAQQIFSLLAGLIMLYVGLSVLGLIRWPGKFSASTGCLLTPLFTHFLNTPGLWGCFTAGLATGLLPCGLVYSFLAMAVASGSFLAGMLIMIIFGLGTVPAMVFIGCGSHLLSHTVRWRIYRLAACIVIGLGLVTIHRAIPRSGGSCCTHATTTP